MGKWVTCPSGRPKSATAPPEAPPGSPSFTEDDELERELALREKSPSTLVLVQVGPSDSASKTVTPPSSSQQRASASASLALQVLDHHTQLDCPMVVNKHNWDGGSKSAEEFRIKLHGGKLTATRTDNAGMGWTLDLAFKCSTKTPVKDPEQERERQLKKNAEDACKDPQATKKKLEKIGSELAEQSKRFGRLFGSKAGIDLKEKMKKQLADAKRAFDEAVKKGKNNIDAVQKSIETIDALRKEQHAAKWKLAKNVVRDLVSNSTLDAEHVLGQVGHLVKDNLVKRFDFNFEKLSKDEFESKKLMMTQKISQVLNVSAELISLLFIGGGKGAHDRLVKNSSALQAEEFVQLEADAGAGSVAVLIAGDADSPLDSLAPDSGAVLASALGASQAVAPSPESSSESGLSTVAIIGIVFGSLFGIISLLVLVGIHRRRAHKRARNKQLLDEHLAVKAKSKQSLGAC